MSTLKKERWKTLRKKTIADEICISAPSPSSTSPPRERPVVSADYFDTLKYRHLNTLRENDTFGEIGFCLGGGATANVVASSKQVVIYVIEKTFLDSLFEEDVVLGAKFYKYLCTSLERSLQSKERRSSIQIEN